MHLLSVGLTYAISFVIVILSCCHCAAQSVSPFSFICSHSLKIGAGLRSISSVVKREAVGANAGFVHVTVTCSFCN